MSIRQGTQALKQPAPWSGFHALQVDSGEESEEEDEELVVVEACVSLLTFWIASGLTYPL